MPDPSDYQDRNKKNLLLLAKLMVIVFAMVALSFASVPLYNLFCKVTGYGGTTGVSKQISETVLDRQVKVRFHAETALDLPWYFKEEQNSITVKLGQGGLASFIARNEAAYPVGGTAIYNVTPLKAGKYFKKIQCFCFDQQILQPGQEVHMPVYFYVDPEMDKDPFLKDVKTITLSYNFFKAESAKLDKALEDFYEADGP